MHFFENLDKKLFLFINQILQNRFFDTILPWCRKAENWYPFYLILIIYVAFKLKKNIFIWLLFFISTIVITDLLSSWVIKPIFHRLRPCNDPFFKTQIRLLINCPAFDSWSFTSSHATNHFGMAGFFFVTLKKYVKNGGYLFFLWASIIGYAQIYVGVHYPFDIIAGAIIGISIGLFIGLQCKRKMSIREI